MKLLFDQNLSHHLPKRLGDLFPDSAHIRLLGMDRAADEAIWNYAAAHGFVIVTQDSDFAERSKLFGSPPKIVWLRCGNTTPEHIELLIRFNSQIIDSLNQDSANSFIELY